MGPRSPRHVVRTDKVRRDNGRYLVVGRLLNCSGWPTATRIVENDMQRAKFVERRLHDVMCCIGVGNRVRVSDCDAARANNVVGGGGGMLG